MGRVGFHVTRELQKGFNRKGDSGGEAVPHERTIPALGSLRPRLGLFFLSMSCQTADWIGRRTLTTTGLTVQI